MPNKKYKYLRPDGSKKGSGYFGMLKLPTGGVTSEYSVGIKLNNKETLIPTLVPTLTKEELSLMTTYIIPNRMRVPDFIMRKAIDHARIRMISGLSPFKD